MTSAAKKQDTPSLDIGTKAPDISLPTDGEGQFNLAAYKGKNAVVIYFYPKDDTPGCTTESKDFRDHMDAFEKAGAIIIGISKCSVAKHDKFKAKHCLPFALASDEEGDVCERYGVWVEKNMYGKKYMGIQRATFIVAKDGTISHIWPKVKVNGHAEEVLQAVQGL